MNKMFSAQPLWQSNGLALLRIITGLLLVVHGIEVFSAEKMKVYADWETFRGAAFMPYLGKGAEFVGGVLLTIGLLTRPACLLIAGTFLYIGFFIGNGRFWMEDQHPFLFVLLALVFFFTGAGKFSFDQFLFTRNNH